MDNNKIKQILEKEYDHHSGKLKSYTNYGFLTETMKSKKIKHMHKLHVIKKIINELDFIICECCGRIK